MLIAESLGLAALGWVASPVIKDLVTRSITYLGTDIAEGLEDLETILLPQFQLTIQAAQNSPHKATLAKWLASLKNAYYDAEAILHELEYESLRLKVKDEQNNKGLHITSYHIMKPLMKYTSLVNKKTSLMSPQKIKLLNHLKKLKKIAAEAKTFNELLRSTEIENNGNGTITSDKGPPVTSALLPHKVFGRDGDRDQVIEFLLDNGEKGGSSSSSSTRSYSVVAITGIGGAGKTTLARYVYNDPRVVKHFGARMWVCLSQNMDDREVTKNMIECITNKRPDLTNLNKLQNNLMDALQSVKEVLLVLDNFWPSNTKAAADEQWEVLLAPFGCIRERFKILLTARSQEFPVSLLPAKHIRLSDLADTDFLSLFRYYAGLHCSGPESQNDLYYTLGDSIANKLSKSPLAARVVGNELNKNKNIGFWQKTERNVNLSDTMEVLLWSYKLMDVQLQQCFLLFALQPKGFLYIIPAIVSVCVALDFIQLASDDGRTVEDVGLEYFQLIVDNSIIQLVDGQCVLHDLYHDLAETLSSEDCCRITNYSEKKKTPPVTVLHVHLRVTNEKWKEELSSIRHLSNLRTLILENNDFGDVSLTFTAISKYFQNLRVLVIQWWGFKALPREVGNLRNLRYLDVCNSSIEVLPDTLSQLYHLQFLMLPSSVKSLPAKLSKLIKLRDIKIITRNFVIDDTLPPVPYLGRLSSLQSLKEFHVRREKGYELKQLGHLNQIGTSLKIVGLENVRDMDEAVAARLIDKPKLTSLKLVWTGSTDINGLVDVIEALQPPTNLELLTIDGYRGSVYPTWLQEGSALPCLQSVEFYNCNALEVLPSNFSQFCYCRQLILQNLGALKELPAFPVNLAKLCIIKCASLIMVRENEQQLQVDDFQSIVGSEFLPFGYYPWNEVLNDEVKMFEQIGLAENCHKQLQIIKSAIIKDNIGPEKWEDVVGRAWRHCHQQRMEFFYSGIAKVNRLNLPVRLRILVLSYCCISDGALSDCLRDMASLQELKLEAIMTITTLPPADVLQTLQSLRDLEMFHCWCLRSLGGLHALPHIQNFHLVGCWRLEMENDDHALLPPTLQTVIIKGSIISNNILSGNFSYLQEVRIQDCKVPDSLSFHDLNSLQTLYVTHCSSLRLIKLCPIIGTLVLAELPNLYVQSVLDSWRGCRQLVLIGSSLMLNELLLSESFVAPLAIVIHGCQEENISFVKSVHVKSVKALKFLRCKTKNLPSTLRDFSALDAIVIEDCPELLELSELPGSVQWIKITNCPKLRERCQPSGPDWHKIQRIKNKWID